LALVMSRRYDQRHLGDINVVLRRRLLLLLLLLLCGWLPVSFVLSAARHCMLLVFSTIPRILLMTLILM